MIDVLAAAGGGCKASGGRVTMSLVTSFENALAKYPWVQRATLGGLDVLACTELGPRAVLYTYRDYHGWLDCAELGVIEGMAAFFGVRPTIEIDVDEAAHWNGTYQIRW